MVDFRPTFVTANHSLRVSKKLNTVRKVDFNEINCYNEDIVKFNTR